MFLCFPRQKTSENVAISILFCVEKSLPVNFFERYRRSASAIVCFMHFFLGASRPKKNDKKIKKTVVSCICFGRCAPKMKKKTGKSGGEKPSTIAKSRPKAVRSTRGRLALGVDFRELEKSTKKIFNCPSTPSPRIVLET